MKSKVIIPARATVILVLLLAMGNLNSQDFTIKSYTTDEGLPHNNIRAIARDSSGFIWLTNRII